MAPRTTAVDPDAADVSLALQSDTHAFERMYRRHAPRLHALAVKFVGTDMADDALQDIFVHAWDRLSQFRGDALFGTWLHRLSVNLLIRQADTVRRVARRFGHTDPDDTAAHVPPPHTRLDVDSALRRLAPEIRVVVVLHDLEGYAHSEIATTLGISTSASKMRLHRGRLQLREWLVR